MRGIGREDGGGHEADVLSSDVCDGAGAGGEGVPMLGCHNYSLPRGEGARSAGGEGGSGSGGGPHKPSGHGLALFFRHAVLEALGGLRGMMTVIERQEPPPPPPPPPPSEQETPTLTVLRALFGASVSGETSVCLQAGHTNSFSRRCSRMPVRDGDD